MSPTVLAILVGVCLLTSIVSVITGSTSLITVPAMLQLGVEPRTAIATNMFALIWMSVGGTVPFLGTAALDSRRLPALIGLTMAGSLLGAVLVLSLPATSIPQVVAVAMLGVAAVSLLQRRPADQPERGARSLEWAGYAATFVLGIYGGFFSGGYVTLLTASYVALFGMRYVEAIAITKVINIFSSLVATAVFMLRGAVDYRLGIILGAVMFLGAVLGSRLALRLHDVWLRRIFLATVALLALKLLLG